MSFIAFISLRVLMDLAPQAAESEVPADSTAACFPVADHGHCIAENENLLGVITNAGDRADLTLGDPDLQSHTCFNGRPR